MTTHHKDQDASMDDMLRQQLQGGSEPRDDGFSLRVMAALAPKGVSARQRRWARWVRRAQWLAISLAACAIALLLADGLPDQATPQALAAACLAALLIYWVIPSRWSRG